MRAPAAPLVGTYANTTGPLSVNGTATGLTASSTLTVASAPAGTGVCGLTVAQWDFGTVAAPTLTVSTVWAGVGTATIVAGNGLTTASDTTLGGPAASSMRMYGWQNAGPINTATSAYVEFAIDTDSYTGVVLQFNARRSNPGPSTSEIWYSTNGGTSWTQKATFNATTAWAVYGPYDFTGQTNASGTTLFRIYGFGANNQNSSSDLNVDQMTFTGCGAALQPTLTKTFSPTPITVGGTSTLTFTLTNPNTAALTGVKFLDTLPTGLQVAPSVSAVTTCGGSPAWAPTAGATALAFGQTTGATIPASSSCTATVSVVATSTGPKLNISDFIVTTESGANTTATGSAIATLTVGPVVLPPFVAKSFSPATIAQGGASILSITITNPNATSTLTGVQLNDNYPSGLLNASPLSPPVVNTCGGTLNTSPGGAGFLLTAVTIASQTTCTIEIPVTSSLLGAKVNTADLVLATGVGNGNQASATLNVVAATPGIKLSKKVRIAPAGPSSTTAVVSPGNSIEYQFVVENIGNVPFALFDELAMILCGWHRSGPGWVRVANIELAIDTTWAARGKRHT